jgi:hypothetical protein
MNKINLTYESAHSFVEKNKEQGFFWDNYTIVKFSPHSLAYTDKKGVFKNNKWGFVSRFDVKSDGTWDLSAKYEKFI